MQYRQKNDIHKVPETSKVAKSNSEQLEELLNDVKHLNRSLAYNVVGGFWMLRLL